jgi:predicted transposase YbfD/YdcC
VLAKLGPLDPAAVIDLRPYLETVPDPRSRRGRWYSLTAVLLVCACAVLSGAKSIDELAEWGQRAETALLETVGIRTHLLKWRRSPSTATIDRILTRLDGDALDAAIGAYLADRHRAAASDGADATALPSRRRRAIAVDGKALKGSARLELKRRHLLSAVAHGVVVTLAQVEVGSKTNETTHFQPLLAPLDLKGAVLTFDALHSVKANITWLVEEKQAHYIAVIKTNQPIAHAQVSALPWNTIGVQHTTSETGHGRVESRSIKTMAICDELGGIAFPHAKLAIRIHRRRKQTGKKETRRTDYAVTSLDAHQTSPAELAELCRGQWGIENSSHYIRDVTFAEDASTVHHGTAPRAMAAFRNLVIGALKIIGADNIAKTTRAIGAEPERALPFIGISYNPDPSGT